MMMLAVRAVRRFCEMKYYREIAAFLKIKVPILNEEIKISSEALCVVHGIKRLDPELALPPSIQPTVTNSAQENQQDPNATPETSASPSVPDVTPVVAVAEPLYIYDKYSQEQLPFGKAVSLSQSLKMDLNLLRQGSAGIYPILTMSAFRRHVYSQYYLAHVKRRGRSGWKSIRLGERIEDNDIRTKIDNIQRMLKAGERRFRLQARNDSDRSEKVIEEFAKFFGKEVEPSLVSFPTPDRKKEDRWVAMLEFDEEVPVDIAQVNKKWRRRQFQQQSKHAPEEQLHHLFEDTDVRAEREIYHAYKELGIKMPPRFEKMAEEERNMESDRYAFYRSVQDEGEEMEESWDSEEQAKFQQKMDRHNKQFFKERTASEIMDEMQALKSSGYESEAHKVARFKQLKAELQAIIKRHQDNDL